MSSPTTARVCVGSRSSWPTCTPAAPASRAISGRSFTIKEDPYGFSDETSSRQVFSKSRGDADLSRYCSNRTPAAANSCAQLCGELLSNVASSITYSLGRTRRITLFSVRSQQPLDEMRIDFPRSEIGVRQNPAMQRNRRLDPFNDEHFQRPLHPPHGLRAISALNDQLRNHRIIIGRDYRVRVRRGIHPYAGTTRSLKRCDASCRGNECIGVLGVNTAFNGMTRELHFADGFFQALPSCYPNLSLNQVHARHQLRHRVLDLNARIHFDKIKRTVLVHQEFHGARIGVPDLLQRAHHFHTQIFAPFGIHAGRWGFLNQFLVAPLNAAFPLAEMNDFAVLVAKHLKFNVTRVLQKSLRVHIRIPKGLLRLAARCLICRKQLILIAHNAHSPATTTSHGFQDQRIADSRRLFAKLLFAFDDTLAPGNGRQSSRFYFPSCAVFLPHHFDDFRSRAYKRNLRSLANLGE